MTEAVGKCMICGSPCFHHTWLCQECYQEHEELQTSFASWSEWAKELNYMHEAERGRERDILEYEVDLGMDSREYLYSLDNDSY